MADNIIPFPQPRSAIDDVKKLEKLKSALKERNLYYRDLGLTIDLEKPCLLQFLLLIK